MLFRQPRWALLCVAATTGALLAISAEASTKHVVKPGDTVETLARKYHVFVKDIVKANGITAETLLRDGRVLTIPDRAPSVVRPDTMRVQRCIKGNRIGVRLGPGAEYGRVGMLDHGMPVRVTNKEAGWCQISVGDRGGWVRGDFVAPYDSKLAAIAIRRAQAQVREEDASARRVASSTGHRRRSSIRRRYAGRERPSLSLPWTSADVVRTAYAYRGTPYRYGGASRRGFDCSGLTSTVFARKGVSLPHSSSAQYQRGRSVSRGALRPGDLVFFSRGRRSIGHVGIYAGDGKFIHASRPGGSVRVDSLKSGYYSSRYRGAKRVR